jgi:hypothetical protein
VLLGPGLGRAAVLRYAENDDERAVKLRLGRQLLWLLFTATPGANNSGKTQ